MFLVLAIAIGETITGPPSQTTGKITPRDILLFIGLISMVAGIVVAWFREGLGGFLTVGGFVFFYAVHLIVDKNLPAGWFLIIFLIIGILFVFCWWQSRRVNRKEP